MLIMKEWMSGIRGAILLVVLWVIGWGLGYGGLMEAFVDPDGNSGDIWPVMLAVPGFVGGVIFAVVLVVAERGRNFDDISLARFAVWGGITGILLGLLTIPAEVGDLSPGAAGMAAMATVLGIVAGIGCGLFFRLISWWKARNVPSLK